MQTEMIKKTIEFAPNKEYVFLEGMNAMVSRDGEWVIFISFDKEDNEFFGHILNLNDGSKHDVYGNPVINLFVTPKPLLTHIQARARVAIKRLNRVLEKEFFSVPQLQN